MSERVRLGRVDAARALDELRGRPLNYDPAEVNPRDWKFDAHRAPVGFEEPGPPVPGGLWETACALLRDYQFTPPELIRAVYRRSDPLLGRDMLLEGRWTVLRFYMGVRITEIVDRVESGAHHWGWAYQTLGHHLERGRVRYEVVKHSADGRVEFHATVESQRAPGVNPVVKLGWAAFGRRTQLRFYRRIAVRMRELTAIALDPARHCDAAQSVAAADPGHDLVLVPSGTELSPFDRLALQHRDPG